MESDMSIGEAVTIEARRLVNILIDKRQVLELFMANGAWPQFIQVPAFENLPDGYRIVGVQHDWHFDAFVFTVEHEAFDLVEPGSGIPTMPCLMARRGMVYERPPLRAA